jgi:hypothetical protein
LDSDSSFINISILHSSLYSVKYYTLFM